MKKVPCVNEEREFLPHELFFSTTDERGMITAGNEVFVRVSAYTREELLGAPHSAIRHPDMPRCVFRLLWTYLQGNRPICAYVKNRAKDGKYYWVLALASPIAGGYLSVRLKPTSPLLATVEGLYKELLAVEKKVEDEPGATKDSAIAASLPLAVERITSLGFESYDEFMEHALRTELASREATLKKAGYERPAALLNSGPYSGLSRVCQDLISQINVVFEDSDKFQQLKKRAERANTMVGQLSRRVQRAALNVTIQAERHGQQAQTISVIAQYLQTGSQKLSTEISDLTDPIKKALAEVRVTFFDLGAAKLQLECILAFLAEISADTGSDAAQQAEKAKAVKLLAETASATTRASLASVKKLRIAVSGLAFGFAQLKREVVGLGLVHVNGRAECARLTQAEQISAILGEVISQVADVRTEIEALEDATGSAVRSVSQIEDRQTQMHQACRKVHDLSKVESAH